LTFADGETSKTFTISILDDSRTEGNETVLLALKDIAGGAKFGLKKAVLTILDKETV
jgi:hypothetical protein